MIARVPTQFCGVVQLTQYSEKDWCYANRQKYGNADRRCSLSRVITEECNRACNELHERTIHDNQVVTKTHEERIREVQYWKEEADNRVGRMHECINRLLEFKDRIRNAMAHYAPLLTSVSQCLLVRTEREGIERVDDRTQQMLQKCVPYFRHLLDILEKLLAEVIEQTRSDRAAKFRLDQDLNDRYTALDIEMIKANMSPPKPTPDLLPGLCPDARCVTVDEWLGFCMHSIKKAEQEEINSQSLYVKVEKYLNESYRDFEKNHKMVIEAMEDRVKQTREAKTLLEERLAKVIKEIENLDEAVLRLQEALDLKISMLSMSQTKLNIQRYRPHAELCRDKLELELEREVIHLDDSVQQLQRRLNWAKNMLRSLHNIRVTLEEDIRLKNHTIFLDEVHCIPIMDKINVVPF